MSAVSGKREMESGMNICIIPSYKPDMTLIDLLKCFEDSDITPLVVDDGGGDAFAEIFSLAESYAIVLHHDVNKGKGAALKTAIAYMRDKMPEAEYAVTADSDGQHTFEQIKNAIEYAKKYPEALILGGRKFDGKVPFKSRYGNMITRQVFAVASGVHVYDTQTGLRAFSRSLFDKLITISGDRYEYEMNMLLELAREGVQIVEFGIETIYINDNKASHFNPLRDAVRIYACILKYGISSILSFLIDYGLFVLFTKLLEANIEKPMVLSIFGNSITLTAMFLGLLGARIISSVCNFTMNNKLVFRGNENTFAAFVKYVLLVIMAFICDYLLLKAFVSIGIVIEIAKIVSAVIVFIINMVVQGRFVFRKKNKDAYIKL